MTEPQSMVSWGLDLSTNPKKCAAVAIRWDHGRPEVVDVRTPLKPDAIVDLIFSEDAPFAVDVPFGWPDHFIEFLKPHQSAAQRPPDDREAWRKETLARRATDRRLLHLALPLPASFDRLGKTAVMWSAIEFDLARRGIIIDRAGMQGRLCETYPTAALVAWNLPKKKPTLELIESAFPFLQLGGWRERLVTDDVCDALICSLVARGRFLGRTVGPAETEEQARREGWIHVMEQDARWLLDPEGSGKHWLRLPILPPSAESLDEDGPKRTFDFWREDGSQMDQLAEFGGAVGTGQGGAAEQVVNYPFPAAVPARLSQEAWDMAARPR